MMPIRRCRRCEWDLGIVGDAGVPVSTVDGRAYLAAALARGERVVCASCDPVDPIDGAAPWRRLPLVHEPGFLRAFLDFAQAHGVTRVHAAAHTVHAALSALLRDNGIDRPQVANRSSLEDEFARWDGLFERSVRWRELIGALTPDKIPPETPFLAGAIRIAFDHFGESYDEKLAALLACLLDAPAGDIVEIGALFGRSASVLLMGRALGGAARNVFVFDPWRLEAAFQDDMPPAMQDYMRSIEFDRVEAAFEASFAALAPEGVFAAYRATSALGRAVYGGDADGEGQRLLKWRAAPSSSGRIALLHVDGNHDAAYAAEDVELWSPLVAPGGWVVIDDYCWRYGDGPKLAGDALLARWSGDVARSFALGGSLFVQRR